MLGGIWDRTEPASLGDQVAVPGRRTGHGVASILPFLVAALKTRSRIAPQPEDAEPGVDFADSTCD